AFRVALGDDGEGRRQDDEVQRPTLQRTDDFPEHVRMRDDVVDHHDEPSVRERGGEERLVSSPEGHLPFPLFLLSGITEGIGQTRTALRVWVSGAARCGYQEPTERER